MGKQSHCSSSEDTAASKCVVKFMTEILQFQRKQRTKNIRTHNNYSFASLFLFWDMTSNLGLLESILVNYYDINLQRTIKNLNNGYYQHAK